MIMFSSINNKIPHLYTQYTILKMYTEYFKPFYISETDLGSNENLDEGIIQSGKDDQIKPLEKRAINFLVNEYLLLNNYKLTSVTFSEENEDQV